MKNAKEGKSNISINTEISILTAKEINDYKFDRLQIFGEKVTLEAIYVNCLLRASQELDRIKMEDHPYPFGAKMKTLIFPAPFVLNQYVSTISKTYTNGMKIPQRDKYRIMIEFGLTLLRFDLVQEKKMREAEMFSGK